MDYTAAGLCGVDIFLLTCAQLVSNHLLVFDVYFQHHGYLLLIS